MEPKLIHFLLARWGVTSIFIFTGVAFSLGAPPPSGEVLSMTQVLNLTRENNPKIEEARFKWEAAKQKYPQAKSLPDPTLTFVTMKEHLQTRAGPMENKYAVSQRFPFFGKRGAKGLMAKEDAVMAHEAYRSTSLKVFSMVTETYYEIFFMDRAIEVNEELSNQLRNMARVVERKYATGRQNQGRVFRAQAALSKSLNDLITLRQKRSTLLAKINFLMNRNIDSPLIPQPIKDFSFNLKSKELKNAALGHRPEILASQALMNKNKASWRLAAKEFFPDLTLSYEISEIGAGTTNTAFDGKDAQAWGFSINLPIWYNRNVPAYRQAQAEYKSANALNQDWINRTQFEIENHVLGIQTAQRQIKLFEESLLPQAKEAVKSYTRFYESEGDGFLDLLDAIQALLNFELDLVRTQVAYANHKAMLEEVVGLPLEMLSSKGEMDHAK